MVLPCRLKPPIRPHSLEVDKNTVEEEEEGQVGTSSTTDERNI